MGCIAAFVISATASLPRPHWQYLYGLFSRSAYGFIATSEEARTSEPEPKAPRVSEDIACYRRIPPHKRGCLPPAPALLYLYAMHQRK